MNSSTLRRLAADHAALRRSDLPPHWLFSPTDAQSSMPDDLTQLAILLTGPQGTPYAQGLWKVSLRIPEDYPKSPPKAHFRTRMWHPNVEENTGSVCVDTLKKDWDPSLTLRDVLITISCLLIQPNPDSALNSTAGHLLQDDYESFARQARLMTSIHARISPSFREAAGLARRRGEDVDPAAQISGSAGSSKLLTRRPPQTLPSTQIATPQQQAPQHADISDTDEDEGSASKENDPTLSPTPVLSQSLMRPTLCKRPLSDLPCPAEPEDDKASDLSPSEENIANNVPTPSRSEQAHQGPELAERNSFVNTYSRSAVDADHTLRTASALALFDAENGRPAKRVCSDETEQNMQGDVITGEGESGSSATVSMGSIPAKVLSAGMRKASAPGVVRASKATKPRVGLRRL